jgi:hypothetical protein
MSNGQQNDPKEVEFYAAMVNAWLNTKFEHDKSLLTLSAGAIGLLITLVSTVGVQSRGALALYGLALGAFVICLSALLWIFRRNAKHLEGVVQGGQTTDSVLTVLDRIAAWSFWCGVLFSAIVGTQTALHSYGETEREMAEKKTTQGVPAYDSVNGIANMAPQGIQKRSVEGIANLNPSKIPTPAPTPAQQPRSGNAGQKD